MRDCWGMDDRVHDGTAYRHAHKGLLRLNDISVNHLGDCSQRNCWQLGVQKTKD